MPSFLKSLSSDLGYQWKITIAKRQLHRKGISRGEAELLKHLKRH
jgi:hypothetical protein